MNKNLFTTSVCITLTSQHRYIVTAAHCVTKGQRVWVHIGDHDKTTSSETNSIRYQLKYKVQNSADVIDALIHESWLMLQKWTSGLRDELSLIPSTMTPTMRTTLPSSSLIKKLTSRTSLELLRRSVWQGTTEDIKAEQEQVNNANSTLFLENLLINRGCQSGSTPHGKAL